MFLVFPLAVDSVLKRMTIIGVILSFRSLAQEALRDVSVTLHPNPDTSHSGMLTLLVRVCNLNFQRASLKRLMLPRYKRRHLALVHSFVVNVKSLFTLERLDKISHLLALEADFIMGFDVPL